jgi:signal transduction histidine kinase
MMTSSPALPMLSAKQRANMRPYWRLVVFLFTSSLLGSLWLSLLTMIVSVGGQLLLLGIGVPILFLALPLVKAASRIERSRFAFLLDSHINTSYQKLPNVDFWHRIVEFSTDPAIWRDLLYILLLAPLGLFDLMVVAFAMLVPAGLILFPLAALWFPSIPFFSGELWLKAPVLIIFGIMGLRIGYRLIAGMTRVHEIIAQRLLSIPLTVRVAALNKSRTEVLEAALAERQRIAHDLHDGAQQQLIALAMDLGLAKEKLDSEPDAVRNLLLRSHDQVKRLMVELRDLVRGIYPAILTDRGLDAALSFLAGRSPVPVTVRVELPRRFPELIESTAYFFVAEALSNVAKHSEASRVSVILTYEQSRLIIDICDDGHGGADVAAGSGLAGLQSRLTALDGTMMLISPPGGPTQVRGEIPCVL